MNLENLLSDYVYYVQISFKVQLKRGCAPKYDKNCACVNCSYRPL